MAIRRAESIDPRPSRLATLCTSGCQGPGASPASGQSHDAKLPSPPPLNPLTIRSPSPPYPSPHPPPPRSASSARLTGLTATRFTTVQSVDTNILLYAISRDPSEQERAGPTTSWPAVTWHCRSRCSRSLRAGNPRQQAGPHHAPAGCPAHRGPFRRFPIQDITSGLMAALDATAVPPGCDLTPLLKTLETARTTPGSG